MNNPREEQIEVLRGYNESRAALLDLAGDDGLSRHDKAVLEASRAALAHIDTTQQLLREVCEELDVRADHNPAITFEARGRVRGIREARALIINRANEAGIEIEEDPNA